MTNAEVQELLNRYYKTMKLAQEVDESIDKDMFLDYEKKLAVLFFSRTDLLKDFTLLNDNGKVTLKPKDGVIKDEVLKTIYENCKGAIDYIETIIQAYYRKASEKTDEYLNAYLSHFFKVTERDAYHIFKSPLAYGNQNENANVKMYQNLAFMSYNSDYDVTFTDEEIELIIALVSLKEKLTKYGECINYSQDGTYNDLYYATFNEQIYHSDLVDSIIENYPDMIKKLGMIAEKTNNPDYFKAYHLLKNHKEKRTIEDIKEVNNEEKEKYVSQLNKEISNSNSKDADAKEKLNNIRHNGQLKVDEQRKEQRLNELNNNIGTVKTLLDTIKKGFNDYDIYMAQYIYKITNGNYNNLAQINPELFPYVQKALEYLTLVNETIKRINNSLTAEETEYVFTSLLGNLNIGQLLTRITQVLEKNLKLVEPSLPKGADPMEIHDLYYDPGYTIGVYKLPAFSVLVKQNPNLIQILEENGINRMSISGCHYLVEQYIKEEFLDENKTLISYIDNETYQKRQEMIKKFLNFEQSYRNLQEDFTNASTNDYNFGRK